MQVEHDYLWGKYGTINNIMKRGYKICQNITQKDILTAQKQVLEGLQK